MGTAWKCWAQVLIFSSSLEPGTWYCERLAFSTLNTKIQRKHSSPTISQLFPVVYVSFEGDKAMETALSRLASCLLRWPNNEVKETRHRLEEQDPLFSLFLNQNLTLESWVIFIKASRTCSYFDITTKHLPALILTLPPSVTPDITME